METIQPKKLSFFSVKRPTTISEDNKKRIFDKYGRDVEWRYIPKLEHLAISEFGDIISFVRYKGGRFTCQSKGIELDLENPVTHVWKRYYRPELLASAFVYNPHNHPFVRWKTGAETFHYSNLEWWSGVEEYPVLKWRKYRNSPWHIISEYGHVAYTYTFPQSIVKTYDRQDGHSTVIIGDKNNSVPIYMLVAEAFLERPEGYEHVLHRDGDFSNVHYSNLIWSKVPFLGLHEMEWKIVPGYPIYLCSEKGDIISNYRAVHQLVKDQYVTDGGICYVTLSRECITRDRVVAITYVPNPNNLPYVVFKDGNARNLHYNNLMWHHENHFEIDERFKQIPDFPRYRISPQGEIRTYCDRIPKVMKPSLSAAGYRYVVLYDEEASYHFNVYRLIAMTHIPNPENKPFVDHINRIKTDDRVENLRWATEKENAENRDNISPRRKVVVQYDLQGAIVQIYESLTQAGELNKFRPQTIRDCIEGKRETYKGYIWEYMDEDPGPYVKEKDEIFVTMQTSLDDEFNFPKYRISNFGNVINQKGYKLKPNYNPYGSVLLYRNGDPKAVRVHRGVGYYFVEGRTAERNIINHRDENPRNNHHTNLEWVTMQENTIYSINRKKYKSVIEELKGFPPKY